MSDDLAMREQDQAPAGEPGGAANVARHDRPPLIAFAADSKTETALQDGLSEAMAGGLDIRRGGVQAAIAAMRRSVTPRTFIIDVGGETRPLAALGRLAELLEPDVQVLVIGDRSDLDFYREVTRGFGGADYLPKPLSRDMVLRHFAPLVSGQTATAGTGQGGRFLSVTGVRGGTGATTIAAHLAWYLAVDRRQHTALLDVDLHRGNAAMLLGMRVTGGLRTAMETPARVDELFIERTAQILDGNPAADRLSVLAGEERLSDLIAYEPGAAVQLVRMMQRRYAVIVGDVPPQQERHMIDFMELAHRRILVMEPTLASIRDMLRMLASPGGTVPTQRPIVVLNRAGLPGGLTQRQVEHGLGLVPDVVVADLPRQLGPAATLGLPQSALRGRFREAILVLAKHAAFEPLLDSSRPARATTSGRRQTDPTADRPSRAGVRFGRRV